MASGQTANYQLNQWEAEDKVLRTEFNEDNTKIDSVLQTLTSQMPKIVVGTYTGNSNNTSGGNQFISLGFTPKAVYVCTSYGATYDVSNFSLLYGGLAVTGSPVKSPNGGHFKVLEIEENGFRVYYGWFSTTSSAPYANIDGQVYHYIAFA